MRIVVPLAFGCLLSITGFAQESPPPPPEPARESPLFTGAIPTPPDVYKAVPIAAVAAAGPAVLKDSVDLSPSFPPPGDQGKQPSCVAWATAYAAKTYVESLERHWQPPRPPNQVFSPAFVYNQLAYSGCSSGIFVPDALNLLVNNGAAPMHLFPYDENDCSRLPDEQTRYAAYLYRLNSFGRLNSTDEYEVKKVLAEGTAVIIVMEVDTAFRDLQGDTVWQGIFSPSQTGFHAMTVVGYDDAKAAFKVINSWGSEWGVGGYGYVSYTAFSKHVREAYTVRDWVEPAGSIFRHNPQYVELTVRQQRQVRLGELSRELTTGDHHCSAGCEGEPTRTTYHLALDAPPGTELRNPQLRCISGPCHGWNTVHYARLEDDGKRATASFDVWSQPTVWQLIAEHYRTEDGATITTRLPAGESIDITSLAGGPAPLISAKIGEEKLDFRAGELTGSKNLAFLTRERRGDVDVFTYEFAKRRNE